MPLFVKARTFLRNLFSFRDVEADLDQEVHSHLEMLTEENIRAGMSPQEAQRAARIELGGIEQVKEQVREERLGNWLQSVLSDCRYALRQFRKNPAFTAVAILTLALGIGCATTMFSLFEGPILNRPPVRDLDRIANIWVVNRETGTERGPLSIPNFLDLRNRTTAFEELAALAGSDKVLTAAGEPERIAALMVSANYFDMLGASAKLGRVFSQDEDQPGAPHVAVISEAMWRTRFGGRPDVLGQSMRFNDDRYTIIGVMPRSFWFQDQGTEVWTPLTLDPSANRAEGTVLAIGRMKKGVTGEQANAEMAVLARALELQFPSANRAMGMRAVTYESEMSKKTGLGLAFGLGPSILVLLIGCANITNLLLARGLARQTEFATRAALGARRSRIVRQLLSEYLLIAIAGGIAGMLAAYGGVAVLRRAFESVQPSLAATLSLNGHALAFGTIATLLIPLLFGLVPAIRVSKASLNDGLRRASTKTGAQVSLRRLPLTVLEIAVSMTLLIVTASAVRTMSFIERVAPPRIDTGTVIAFTIMPTPHGSKLDRLLVELSAAPGIDAVGITSGFPMVGSRSYVHPLWVRHEGANIEVSAVQLAVDRGFFNVLRLSAVQGELAPNGELSDAVVSESFARRYGSNALGLQIRNGDNPWVTVTAVVPDWLTDARSGNPVATVYLPLSKADTASQVVVRAESGPAAIPALKRAVRAWNPHEPLGDCKTVAQSIKEEFAGSNLIVQLMASFTILALALACIGVYGVMSYSVTRRTHEMGIRMALGAAPSQVLQLVLKEAGVLIVVGLGSGWLFGVAAGRLIAHELVVAPYDPVTAIACSATILVAGLAACYIPARRATRVDPIVALRYE
jgi:predicted permease